MWERSAGRRAGVAAPGMLRAHMSEVDLAASRTLPEQLQRMDRSIADQERALEADDLIAWLAANDDL